jgi:hypothetical protein
MSLRTAAQQALEALESVYPYTDSLICYASTTGEHPPNAIDGNVRDAITALRTALAEPERKPLTDEEIALIVGECAASAHRHDDFSFARAIERAHGIGGEA